MPYLRKATDAAFGLMPYDAVLRQRRYRTDASAEKIWAGDLVALSTDGLADPIDAVTTTQILGVAANTVASGSASEVFVYDHPEQLFVIQDDNDTTAIASANIGNHADPINLTGNDQRDRSLTELDSSSAAASGTKMLRIVGLHEIEENDFIGAAGQTNGQRRWIVKISQNFHAYATGSAL